MPKVFISYSWDNPNHKSWVRDLAASLREDGVEVILDQWDLILGDSLTQFMEKAISESDYILIICTPNYKRKADNRIGGVGYEENIITAQSIHINNKRKFIPILRKGSWRESAPIWLMDRMYEDLSGAPYSEENYIHLLATIHNIEIPAPPIGEMPLNKINKFHDSLFNKNVSKLHKDDEFNLEKENHKEQIVKDLNSVHNVMSALKEAVTIGECKVLDNRLSQFNSELDRNCIKDYLYNGNQRQRNYAALYFKRKGYYQLLMEAYEDGKIDKTQAFSR